MNIIELEQQAYDSGLIIYDYYLSDRLKGIVFENNIALQRGMTSAERLCVLAEEIAHYEISHRNILNQSIEQNRYEEARARRMAYDMLIGKDFIIEKIEGGVSTIYELAEVLELPLPFVMDAVRAYGIM